MLRGEVRWVKTPSFIWRTQVQISVLATVCPAEVSFMESLTDSLQLWVRPAVGHKRLLTARCQQNVVLMSQSELIHLPECIRIYIYMYVYIGSNEY